MPRRARIQQRVTKTMFDYYLSGASLRLVETVIYASLWIVIGCFIAAIFRRMLGAEQVRRIFADQTRFGLLAGWLIGMLLPVCSLGVIPIVREMNRCGVKRGTIVAFGLTAPLFNPMSVLYGLTLSDPIAILSFSICALLIVSAVGGVWNWVSTAQQEHTASETVPSVGSKRSIALFYTAARELVGPSLIYILIGIGGSIALAILLPKGQLQHEVDHDNFWAPIQIAFIATPIYSTPLLAMSQIGGMFQHGNSIGAAFSLLILGAGANIGLLAWIGKTYGFHRLAVFYLVLMTLTVGLAFVVNKPLYPEGVVPAGHTHAFDVYTHPFDSEASNYAASTLRRGQEFWAANEFGGTYLLAILIVMGTATSLLDRQKVETWLMAESNSKSNLEREVPSWALGLVTVTGLVVASVVGCFLYYPEPKELFRDLSVVNTEAVLCSRNGNWEAADKWIRYCDDLSRRLEVGVYLRTGSVGEFQSTKAKIYRERLDDLKMIVDTKDKANAAEVAMEVSQAYQRLHASFTDEP